MTPAEERRGWAYALIGRSNRPPARYGSPEWLALPEGPEKVAAVVVAAENWARDGDDLEERLWLEVEMSRAAFKATEDAEFVARRDHARAAWSGSRFARDPDLEDDIDREWAEWAGGAA